MNKKVFKIKKRHLKKIYSYGVFYRKIGLLKYLNKHPEHKFNVRQFHTNKKTYENIHENIKEFYRYYDVFGYRNNKIVKKDKEFRGELSKALYRSIAMDSLNYAPYLNDDIPDNEIWILW